MEQEILGLINPIINSNSVWKNHALKFLVTYITQMVNRKSKTVLFNTF